MSLAETTVNARPEPTKFYRWLVLIFLSLAMFGNYYFYDALEPLAKLLQEQLHFSAQNIGMLQAAYSFPNIFTVVLGGILIDRIGTRKALLIFGVLCLIGAFITAFGAQFPMMVAGRFVFGMGAESLIVAITTGVAKWFKGKELSFALGINLMIARGGTWLAQNSPSWAPGAYTYWQKPWLIGVGFVSLCVIGPSPTTSSKSALRNTLRLHPKASRTRSFSPTSKLSISRIGISSACASSSTRRSSPSRPSP